MPISIIDNFQVNKLGPIDVRMIATNSAAKDAIAFKYDGLKVFQTDNRISYTWNAGTSNWDIDSTGSITGTGSVGYLPSWLTQTSLGDSPVYTNITGSLSGTPVGVVGINTPSIGPLSPKGTLQINSPLVGGAPPTVITKGTSTIISENWYSGGAGQVFDTTRGSSLLEFNNGTLVIKTRTANNPSDTYNKLRITPTDIEVSSYEGGTPPIGTVMGSIVARSLTYNYNLGGIKFLSDGTWGGGQFPTSTVFYSMTGSVSVRAMTIKPEGRVIIGATSGSVPEQLLVEGDVRVQNVINFGPYSTPTYNRTSYIWSAPNFLQINRQTNHPIDFATNNVNRMTISADGNVGIGTGTNSIFSRLVVSNYSQENFEFSTGKTGSFPSVFNGGVIEYINRNSAGTRPNINYYIAANVTMGQGHRFWTGGGERLQINNQGLWLWTISSGIGSTLRITEGFQVVYDASARILKKDISNLSYGLKEVLSMSPKNFKWKKDDKKDIGFIADEMYEIAPEIVNIATDKFKEEGLNEGEPISINYDRLTAILVKAIQEQQAQIDDLKKEIEKLKTIK
jgi:hypothetical protein